MSTTTLNSRAMSTKGTVNTCVTLILAALTLPFRQMNSGNNAYTAGKHQHHTGS
jgi:hypothetical protein